MIDGHSHMLAGLAKNNDAAATFSVEELFDEMDSLGIEKLVTFVQETERIYGESWLRFAYGHPLGRLFLHAFVKRPFFSCWYGRRMGRPASRRLIAPFIADFDLDPAEFADPVESFATFNDFFKRI